MIANRIRRRRDGGFSQMEMLVVLGIVAALFGMAWPRLRTAQGTEQLRDAAQQVRIELMRARLRAVETGNAQVFSYRRGGRDFAVAPRGYVRLESGEPIRRSEEERHRRERMHEGSRHDETVVSAIEKSLPDSVAFETDGERTSPVATDGSDPREIPREMTRRTMPSEHAAEDFSDEPAEASEWVELPPFLPNGTCDDARLSLVNEQGASVDVTVHGLTGIVVVGEARIAQRDDSQVRR